MTQHETNGDTMTKKRAGHAFTRRNFVRMMIAVPLACGAMTIAPTDAEAATTSTFKVGYTKLVVPTIWKQKLRGIGMGHTSGVYNYHLKHKKTGVGVLMLIEGPYREGEAKGKTSRKRTGSLEWQVKRGNVSTVVCAYNVPYVVWQSAHGEGGYTLSKKDANELLKISTGGKIKYGALVKLSRKTARSKGEKAVRSWVSEKIVKRIKLV